MPEMRRWAPKPATVLRTSRLKPTMMETAIIITASPTAMPAMAMSTAGRDTRFPPAPSR